MEDLKCAKEAEKREFKFGSIGIFIIMHFAFKSVRQVIHFALQQQWSFTNFLRDEFCSFHFAVVICYHVAMFTVEPDVKVLKRGEEWIVSSSILKRSLAK